MMMMMMSELWLGLMVTDDFFDLDPGSWLIEASNVDLTSTYVIKKLDYQFAVAHSFSLHIYFWWNSCQLICRQLCHLNT